MSTFLLTNLLIGLGVFAWAFVSNEGGTRDHLKMEWVDSKVLAVTSVILFSIFASFLWPWALYDEITYREIRKKGREDERRLRQVQEREAKA